MLKQLLLTTVSILALNSAIASKPIDEQISYFRQKGYALNKIESILMGVHNNTSFISLDQSILLRPENKGQGFISTLLASQATQSTFDPDVLQYLESKIKSSEKDIVSIINNSATQRVRFGATLNDIEETNKKFLVIFNAAKAPTAFLNQINLTKNNNLLKSLQQEHVSSLEDQKAFLQKQINETNDGAQRAKLEKAFQDTESNLENALKAIAPASTSILPKEEKKVDIVTGTTTYPVTDPKSDIVHQAKDSSPKAVDNRTVRQPMSEITNSDDMAHEKNAQAHDTTNSTTSTSDHNTLDTTHPEKKTADAADINTLHKVPINDPISGSTATTQAPAAIKEVQEVVVQQPIGKPSGNNVIATQPIVGSQPASTVVHPVQTVTPLQSDVKDQVPTSVQQVVEPKSFNAGALQSLILTPAQVQPDTLKQIMPPAQQGTASDSEMVSTELTKATGSSVSGAVVAQLAPTAANHPEQTNKSHVDGSTVKDVTADLLNHGTEQTQHILVPAQTALIVGQPVIAPAANLVTSSPAPVTTIPAHDAVLKNEHTVPSQLNVDPKNLGAGVQQGVIQAPAQLQSDTLKPINPPAQQGLLPILNTVNLDALKTAGSSTPSTVVAQLTPHSDVPTNSVNLIQPSSITSGVQQLLPVIPNASANNLSASPIGQPSGLPGINAPVSTSDVSQVLQNPSSIPASLPGQAPAAAVVSHGTEGVINTVNPAVTHNTNILPVV